MLQPLFDGPNSLRHRSERLAFWLTALLALPAAAVLGFFIHQSIGVSQVALFIVAAMIYVTLARGRLLGSSVMLHETQYTRVFAIVKRACAALEIPMPLVFVREDIYVPTAALGFGEPYALVISSHWIEAFRDDELAFMIGRELGHIAAGHTRYLSLLSVNGNENAFISATFGAWLRRCATTCDRVGLLCCGSLDAAIRAIGVASFHEFGRRIDYETFAEQHKEIENDAVMRWGVWLGSEPYATTRIALLHQFIASHAYEVAEQWFLRERADEPPALPTPGTSTVERVDCSGWWRRFGAFSIDVIVVLAIVGSVNGRTGSPSDVSIAPVPVSAKATRTNKMTVTHPFENAVNAVLKQQVLHFAGATVLLGVYLAVLVAVVGQTFGMMIMGLRVVTRDFRRPGPFRTIFRYLIAAALWPLIALISPFGQRVYLHDKFTSTRVIGIERLVARAIALAT